MTTFDQALVLVIRNLRGLKAQWQHAMKGRRAAQKALAALRRVPGRPVYPIRWQSERQRRKFFATKGFGRGIPAKRGSPPKVTQGWAADFTPLPDGGRVDLLNPVPHMKFVQGMYAQPFHLDTGWVQVKDVASDFYREEETAMLDLWLNGDLLEGIE